MESGRTTGIGVLVDIQHIAEEYKVQSTLSFEGIWELSGP